jgi:hypothetical protein
VVCSRGETYRICLAEPKDGTTWHRVGLQDGIDVSTEGWDSEMIEYPCVFDHKGKRYLLYCGNAFWPYRFGIAVAEG